MHLVIIKKMTSNITTPATCAQPPRNQDEGVYIAHGGKYKQDSKLLLFGDKGLGKIGTHRPNR